LHDSGNPANMRTPLATLAALLDRLGRYEPAATMAGFALNPFTMAATPDINTTIAHLRDVLGDQTCESLARKYGFAFTAGLLIGLGLAAQLARVVLPEFGHGEPDDRVDLDLGEVREVTFDARVNVTGAACGARAGHDSA
jgi:hypothetical protein